MGSVYAADCFAHSLYVQLLTLRALQLTTAVSSIRTLGVALAMTLLNQFALEPWTTENMMERYKLEDEQKTETPEYKALRKNFGKLHGMSSLTNLVALCAGVAHAVYLAGKLVSV